MFRLSKLQFAIMFLLFAVGLLGLIAVSKPKPPDITPVVREPVKSSYLERAERENEDEWIEKAQDKKIKRKAELKKITPECSFWKDQQHRKPTPRGAAKVKEYCELKLD